MKINNVFQVFSFVLSGLMLAVIVTGCTIQESDPFLGDFKLDTQIAYVKRPVEAMMEADPRRNARELPPASNDLAVVALARAGNLFIFDPSNPDASPRNITDGKTAARISDNNRPGGAREQASKGPGDVRSPNVSFDGKKIVFSMHEGMLGNDQIAQNTWDIWIYDIPSNQLTRAITSEVLAQERDDYDPVFLPGDKKIVFSSNRNRDLSPAGVPYLDEERSEPALNLFSISVVELGGTIKQITFNQSDDRNPSVLHTGEIVFSRWEHVDRRDQFDLFKVNPDGSALQLLYGAHSHTAATSVNEGYYKPRQMPDGRLLVTVMPYSNYDPNDPTSSLTQTTSGGGELVIIDYENFIDKNTNTPNGSAATQSSGQVTATRGKIKITLGEVSKFGHYASPFPIWEEGGNASRVLTSWTICRVTTDSTQPNPRILPCNGHESLELVPPVYGIYKFNISTNTKSLVLLPDDGYALTDPIVLADRSQMFNTPVGDGNPVEIPDDGTANNIDVSLAKTVGGDPSGVGAISIRSIYDSSSVVDIGLNNLLSTETLPCMGTNNSCVTGPVDIAKLVDPDAINGVSPENRPVRYVRIVSAMATYEDVRGLAYGIVGGVEMRSILGYAPVEADGSVYVEVPAGMPFGIELLDSRGRKFGLGGQFRQHESWLQVAEGETLKCHGCHENHSQATPLNTGAGNLIPAMPDFNNTLTTMQPMFGESMADTRFRIMDERSLSRDLIYKDVWTAANPPNVIPGVDDTIDYTGLTTLPTDCTAAGWGVGCKIVINYAEHIQPLWEVDRGANTCTICHSASTTQVPAGEGQIDLTQDGDRTIATTDDGVVNIINGDNQQLRVTSYEHLVRSQRVDRILDGGGLVVPNEIVEPARMDPVDANNDGIQDVDIDGNPIFVLVPANSVVQTINKGAVVNPFSARGSHLIEVLSGVTKLKANASQAMPLATKDHSGIMSSAEIRLLTEWIDMGAQYFNDPNAVTPAFIQ